MLRVSKFKIRNEHGQNASYSKCFLGLKCATLLNIAFLVLFHRGEFIFTPHCSKMYCKRRQGPTNPQPNEPSWFAGQSVAHQQHIAAS
jgi:hypothetical protein